MGRAGVVGNPGLEASRVTGWRTDKRLPVWKPAPLWARAGATPSRWPPPRGHLAQRPPFRDVLHSWGLQVQEVPGVAGRTHLLGWGALSTCSAQASEVAPLAVGQVEAGGPRILRTSWAPPGPRGPVPSHAPLRQPPALQPCTQKESGVGTGMREQE